MTDEELMREAIRLSIEKMQLGEGGPFGAVIAREKSIIGVGWNQVTSTNDPTSHAEIVAIRNTCKMLGDFTLAGCEIFCSCQPCPMCHGAIQWARIERVYYSASSEQAAMAGFDDRVFRAEFGRQTSEQRIPFVHLLGDEGDAPFEAWRNLPNRIMY